ncbi:polysaccharide deacetylase family protein [Phreatobacter aquaticus]|uniref:Chitooligosaccharide deacetylase n=1 Tax=Phreatobacter aquaticus TaxID=2570229 RepID=A0A4D7QMJ8_9HYPH|nr:polysaccharide deacetylase family protein [Phreatobacter aquaticus]QCK87741.1 polysaccharide deacetylase family protein [Phreatobacter aquaticus]
MTLQNRVSKRALIGAVSLLATPALALGRTACLSDALGTHRVMKIDLSGGLRVGRKSFAQTLDLAPREVVLTFDDGPHPGPTDHVLDALARECVRATFFLIGRMAQGAPALARRTLAEGHTVAHHSMTHPMTLADLPLPRALADIEAGFSAVDHALYGQYAGAPRTPFFRFPGFGSSVPLLDHLAGRGIGVFGCDFWVSDWNDMTPEHQLALTLRRLEQTGGGIILFHDPRPQTAAMIPAFLRELKRRAYKVVHMEPARGAA